MPIFTSPDEFEEHKKYIVLLKKALQVVKPGIEKKFLYFKKYPFGGKSFQLVLVDFDLNCKSTLTKAGNKITAEGLVKLTEQDELNFEAAIGNLKRISLKKYFGKMGPGIKAVFVPPGEVDEEGGGEESQSEEGGAVEGQLPQPPTASPPPPQQPGSASRPPDKPLPQPPADDPAKKKLELDLRKRIEELRKQPVDSPNEQMKTQVLQKAEALVGSGRFPDATLLLDQYVKRVAVPITPKPPVAPKPEAPATPAPSPKLSAYMGAAKRWKDAKTASANGVFALKTAILKECDPELKKAVEAKINEVNGILTVMDDGIIARIQEAGAKATRNVRPSATKLLSNPPTTSSTPCASIRLPTWLTRIPSGLLPSASRWKLC